MAEKFRAVFWTWYVRFPALITDGFICYSDWPESSFWFQFPATLDCSIKFLTSVIPRSTLTACERRVVHKLIDCCEPGIKGNLLLKLIKFSFMMDSRWISNNLELSSLAREKICSMASIFKLAFKQASPQRFCFALTCRGTCFHENLRRDLRHKE